MNTEEKIATVVSDETGEIIDEIYSGDKIVRMTESKKKKEAYKQQHVLNFNKGVSFVKTFSEAAYILSMMLSPKECQFVMGLNKFISYEDCSIKNGYGTDEHFMSLKELSEEMHVEYSRCSRIMTSLISKGVIGKFETGNIIDGKREYHFLMNPYICINGSNPEKSVCKHFKGTGWEDFINEYYNNNKNN